MLAPHWPISISLLLASLCCHPTLFTLNCILDNWHSQKEAGAKGEQFKGNLCTKSNYTRGYSQSVCATNMPIGELTIAFLIASPLAVRWHGSRAVHRVWCLPTRIVREVLGQTASSHVRKLFYYIERALQQFAFFVDGDPGTTACRATCSKGLHWYTSSLYYVPGTWYSRRSTRRLWGRSRGKWRKTRVEEDSGGRGSFLLSYNAGCYYLLLLPPSISTVVVVVDEKYCW